MGIIKKTASASVSTFSLLFGRNNLASTKAHIAKAGEVFKAYKDVVRKDRPRDIDAQAFEEAEYTKRFRTARVLSGTFLLLATAYGYFVLVSPSLFELACRFLTWAILVYMSLALSRFLFKLRLVYNALPEKLSEENGTVTWARYFSEVAEKPSLLLPLGIKG
ncbi:hypothetical protein ACSQ5K_26470 [Pseudomonas sp. PhalM4]